MENMTKDQQDLLVAKLAEIGQDKQEHEHESGFQPDSDLAATLNALPHPTETYTVDVPTRTAMGAMLVLDVYGPVYRAREAGNPDNVRDAAINVIQILQVQPDGVIQTSNARAYSRVEASLKTLTEADPPIISNDAKEKLLALAKRPRGWAEVVFGRALRGRDIGLARGGSGDGYIYPSPATGFDA